MVNAGALSRLTISFEGMRTRIAVSNGGRSRSQLGAFETRENGKLFYLQINFFYYFFVFVNKKCVEKEKVIIYFMNSELLKVGFETWCIGI